MVDSYKYWSDREKAHTEVQKFTDEQIVKQLEANYKASLDDINNRINVFYERYAGTEGISIEDAMKRVSEMDIKAYVKEAKKHVEEARRIERELKRKATRADFSKEVNDNLRLYNATMRINRLEMLKAEINLELSKATLENEILINNHLLDTAYKEFERQAGILGAMVPTSQKHAESLLKASIHTAGKVEQPPWNQTLWTNQEAMAMELNVIIRRAITQGVNATEASKRFADRFGKETYNARRLLVTETAYVQGLVQRDSFKRAGYGRYIYLAESRACKVCQKLDGKDFAIDDAKIGENYYPMHPHCKCSSSPFMSEEEFEGIFKQQSASIFDNIFGKIDITKPRRQLAKNVLSALNQRDIKISVKKINARGYCSVAIDDFGNSVIKDYVLQSNDNREEIYQIKTVFHEAYHAYNNGKQTDMYKNYFNGFRWVDIEETFAETSAHYAMKMKGVEGLSPAYSNILVDTLPRLKKLPKFSNAKTLADFGEIAWQERLNGQVSEWEGLSNEIAKFNHDWRTYGLQYEKYITENSEALIDKVIENSPNYKEFKEYFKTDLENAMIKTKNQIPLDGNEDMIYSNVLINAMNLKGVK